MKSNNVDEDLMDEGKQDVRRRDEVYVLIIPA